MARLPIAAGGPSAANAAIASGEQGQIDTAFRQLDMVIAQRQACAVSLKMSTLNGTACAETRASTTYSEYIGLP